MRSILTFLLFLALAGPALAVELLEARVTAGAAPVLQNAGGTVRLEQAQVNATAHPTFTVPEPGTLGLLVSGLGGLVLLQARRRRCAASRTSSSSSTRSSADRALPEPSRWLPRRQVMESMSKRSRWSPRGAGLVLVLLALATGVVVMVRGAKRTGGRNTA